MIISMPTIRFGQLSEQAAELWHDSQLPMATPRGIAHNLDRFELGLQRQQEALQAQRDAAQELYDAFIPHIQTAGENKDLVYIARAFGPLQATRAKVQPLPAPERAIWEAMLTTLNRRAEETALGIIAQTKPDKALDLLAKVEALQAEHPDNKSRVPDTLLVALRDQCLKARGLSREITKMPRMRLSVNTVWNSGRTDSALNRLPGLVTLRAEAEAERDKACTYPPHQEAAWAQAWQSFEGELHKSWAEATHRLKPEQARHGLQTLNELSTPVPDDWALILLRKAYPKPL